MRSEVSHNGATEVSLCRGFDPLLVKSEPPPYGEFRAIMTRLHPHDRGIVYGSGFITLAVGFFFGVFALLVMIELRRWIEQRKEARR